MRDKLEFRAPLGMVGRIAERLFLTSYMERFLRSHQENFRQIVERGGRGS